MPDPSATPRPEAANSYVVATFNRHKAAELHALLALPGVTRHSGSSPEPASMRRW